MRTGFIHCGILSFAFAATFVGTATPARAGDPPVTVRPAIRITVSPGSKPTAKFVQYGYYSGGWGWGPSYRGWGGTGWGGYGGWGAYGGTSNYAGWGGGYAPVYGSYYGGYPNYGYPVSGYGLAAYAYPGFGYPASLFPSYYVGGFGGYGYGGYGYPGYGYYGGSSCGCGGGYGYGGYGGYGLGYRIW
jgi:hypothetical protein